LREHTGFSSDQFFGVLLNDQAKSFDCPKTANEMASPCNQVVSKNVHTKSHAAYEDLRDSGFLKLQVAGCLLTIRTFYHLVQDGRLQQYGK